MTGDSEILDWRESVRKRPAMYVGSLGIQGFSHVLKDLFAPFRFRSDTSKLDDNQPSPDFNSEKYSFEITNKQSGKFRLHRLKNSITGNINENLYLKGPDFAVLNAICEKYEFTLFDKDNQEILKQVYHKGILQSGIANENEYWCKTLEIKFELDTSILSDFEINPHYIAELIQEFAFLCKYKIFELLYCVDDEPCRVIYRYEHGLRDLIEIKGMAGWGPTVLATELEYQSEDYSADICFSFWSYSINEPFFKSFVNNIYTHEGGTHKKALLLGIGKALKKYVKVKIPNDFFVITDRTILSCLIGAIHLKMKSPFFHGSTKNRLSNQEIIKPISEFIFEAVYRKLEKDPEIAKSVIRHFHEVHWKKDWLKRM